MKRIVVFLLVVIMSIAFCSCSNSKKEEVKVNDESKQAEVNVEEEEIINNDSIKVFVNGEAIHFEQHPIQTGEGVFVSIQEIAEKLGIKTEGKGSGIKSDMWSFLSSDTRGFEFYHNNIFSMTDIAYFVVNEKMMVPLSVVSRVFAADVTWDEINKDVNINTIKVDEEYYNQYKTDKEKPLVMDYEINNKRCKVPQLNINHPCADAINERIWEDLKDDVESIIDSEEKGYSTAVVSLVYHYSVNGDILSVMYISNTDFGDMCEIFSVNYDLKNNRELSFDEVVALSGQDKETHIENAQKKLLDVFDKMYPFAKDMDEETGVPKIYRRAGSDDCYSDKSTLYIEKNGNIMAVVRFPSLAGAASYRHLYDTGLVIKNNDVNE